MRKAIGVPGSCWYKQINQFRCSLLHKSTGHLRLLYDLFLYLEARKKLTKEGGW